MNIFDGFIIYVARIVLGHFAITFTAVDDAPQIAAVASKAFLDECLQSADHVSIRTSKSKRITL